MNAVVEVVVIAEVVSPVLCAVYLIADSILKIAVISECAKRELCAPCFAAVVICINVVELLIVVCVPTVCCVSYEYVLIISIVLKNCVYLISVEVVLKTTESLCSYRSSTDLLCPVVIVAVVVIPDRLAVCLILDSILAVEA